MTREELKEIVAKFQRLNDLETGPYGVSYYERLLDKCKKHERDGLPTIAVNVEFLNEQIMLPASILVNHLEKKIASIRTEIERLKAETQSYKVVKA